MLLYVFVLNRNISLKHELLNAVWIYVKEQIKTEQDYLAFKITGSNNLGEKIVLLFVLKNTVRKNLLHFRDSILE